MIRRLALLGGVLLALAAVAVFALSTKPAGSRATVSAGQTAQVTSVTRSCPPSAPGAGTAHIAMIAVPSHAASSSPAGTAKTTGGGPGGSATVSSVPAALGPPVADPSKSKPTAGGT